MINVPKRPKIDIESLTDDEKDCLTWYVLFSEPLEKCYARFVQPSLSANPRVLNQYVKQFKATAAVRNYISEYRTTLFEMQNIKPKTKAEKKAEQQTALDKFKERVAEKVGEADTLESMETAAKLADRVGMFNEDEDRVEEPRRYLPQSCNITCRYRLFVETSVANGDIVDECKYCRALKYASEHGFKYDPTKLLDLPTK